MQIMINNRITHMGREFGIDPIKLENALLD